GRLEHLGLKRGEPIAVFIESPAKRLMVCLALLHLRIPIAPVDRGTVRVLVSAAIHHLIYEGEPQALVDGKNIRFDDSWMASAGSSFDALDLVAPQPSEDTQLIFFTSGTTGVPKKTLNWSESFLIRLKLMTLTGNVSLARILIMPGLASNFGFYRACIALSTG